MIGEQGRDGGGKLDRFFCVPYPDPLHGVVNAALHAQNEGGDCYA